MKIVDAFRLEKNSRLAIVGGGGKTTLLFQLARQFPGPVIVTTTTHLGIEQSQFADIHFKVDHGNPLPDLRHAIQMHKVILITGEQHDELRLGAIPEQELRAVKEFTDTEHIPLIIEADGSRKLPIKAPADHEPVIPSWVNAVAVVVGLSCVGNPASEGLIHRFGHFAEITGLVEGDAIEFGHIEKMLLHQNGGLKKIPAGARRIAVLNQADYENLSEAAIEAARRMTGAYDAVIVSALGLESLAEEARVLHCAEPIAGVVLAAGGASRYGQPKSLLKYEGETFIRRIVKTALKARLDPVYVVLGATIDEVKQDLIGLPVKFAVNPDWALGQSSSLRVAISELEPYSCGGAIILQADQPRVSVELLEEEIALHGFRIPSIVIPRVDGHPSSPVLFDRNYFGRLQTIEGDRGGRALFAELPHQWLDWGKPKELMDIDTPEEYRSLLEDAEG